MIIFSNFGKEEIQRHSLMPLVKAKLFIADGVELSGNGYEPIELILQDWNLSTGEYPTLEWIFKADIPNIVEGYYIVNNAEEIIFYENFETPQEIQHTGDRISINITLAPIVSNETVGKK